MDLTQVAWSIRAHRDDEAPIEAVGLIFQDGTTHRLINQARNEHRFSVGENAIREALNDHPSRLVAIYHTHPSTPAEPSNLDAHHMRQMAADDGWSHVVSVIYGTDGMRGWIWRETEGCGDWCVHEVNLHYWAEALRSTPIR